MNRDFKVGDIVCGTHSADGVYNCTDSEMTEARVIGVYDEEIKIEVLKHERGNGIGSTFGVDPKYFDLVRREGDSKMNRDFKVGDRVRIREWDDMESEYGLNARGSIGCRKTFVAGMKHLCGRTATISNISDCKTVNLADWSDSSGASGWHYSTDMLELVEDSKMAQVARILGVELGEEFEIEGSGYNPYKFTEDGLLDCEGSERDTRFGYLLTGRYKIKRRSCIHCGSKNEVVHQGKTTICKQCAKEVLER